MKEDFPPGRQQEKRSSEYISRAKAALRRGVAVQKDAKGYVLTPHENLISGVTMDQFETDLRQGDGDELRTKFCALHSSCALAVNTFAPFKTRPEQLVLL